MGTTGPTWVMYPLPPLPRKIFARFRIKAISADFASLMLQSKLNKNLSISVNSEEIFTQLSEQGSIFRGVQNEYSKSCGTIKTEQKLHYLG